MHVTKKALRGQAFLALVFLIGGVIGAIGVTLAIIANSSVDSGYGYQASVQAQSMATSGAEDALLQLDRNAAFSSGGYNLGVGSGTATVTVTQGSPSTGFATILSAATVSSRTRKLNVVVSVNASTSQIDVVSWNQTQ
jgi:hypothetical protein